MNPTTETTAPTTPAADTQAPKGFLCPCPYCGERLACFAVRLAALDDEALECLECNSTFSLDEMRERVREMQARWQPVLAWLSVAPSFPDAEQE